MDEFRIIIGFLFGGYLGVLLGGLGSRISLRQYHRKLKNDGFIFDIDTHAKIIRKKLDKEMALRAERDG